MKTSLKIEPVITKKTPKYPDKYSVALDKMLLASTPARWNNPLINSITGTVLSFSIIATLAGCAASDAGVPKESVAPLFEHGDGIGSFVCETSTSPHFLSETDAIEIIADEFARQGLAVAPSTRVIENVPLPLVGTRGDVLAGGTRD